MNTEYLAELRALSLTARSAVSLLVCEQYFRSNGLESKLTQKFLEHLWIWPTITDFDSWEKKRPFLVNYGLGDDASKELLHLLLVAEIEEPIFRRLISGATEILWGSFWGAAEDEQSFESLLNCIKASGEGKLPVLTPFKFSTYVFGDGWGKPISETDRDFWRFSAKFV